ncbi:hypothetical protein HFO56_23725 [Rhizobium laguerreae]|uniref:hypothetical protein n=1 Tax=Rhizobium laguerreae TaxID=1076926 RepID=UPI001C91CB97|nr:hypothetical protein [Rhizobium laguerreae]MBY3155337.1 hypothetical protein [Rhizobium laguerreae]
MKVLTHGQRHALGVLQRRHVAYPNSGSFPASEIGTDTAAILRRLAPLGFVTVTKGGRGSRQFFSITESGVEQTVRQVGYTCFGCREVLDFECAVGHDDDYAGARGWLIGHWEGNGQYVCQNCEDAIWDALPLGSEEGRKRFSVPADNVAAVKPCEQSRAG